MSTLKADTIQSTSGGAATLTKQSAAKAWCKWHASVTVAGSITQSSMVDVGQGDHGMVF